MALRLPVPANTAATAPRAIPQKARRPLAGVSCPDTNIARASAAELALVRKNVAIKKIRKKCQNPGCRQVLGNGENGALDAVRVQGFRNIEMDAGTTDHAVP